MLQWFHRGGDTIFGSFIRERRQALRLTQRQLGELCGYTGRSAETVVQNWEADRQPVPLDRLRRLAAALEIPVDTLIP